jgi:hypothetical protein
VLIDYTSPAPQIVRTDGKLSSGKPHILPAPRTAYASLWNYVYSFRNQGGTNVANGGIGKAWVMKTMQLAKRRNRKASKMQSGLAPWRETNS